MSTTTNIITVTAIETLLSAPIALANGAVIKTQGPVRGPQGPFGSPVATCPVEVSYNGETFTAELTVWLDDGTVALTADWSGGTETMQRRDAMAREVRNALQAVVNALITPLPPTRLPIFNYKGWRFVSHRVDRGTNYVPANEYDRWLVDVLEERGDGWFQEAYEVRLFEDGHFELHAGPQFAILSAHFDHLENAVFDEVFEAAYIDYIEKGLPRA